MQAEKAASAASRDEDVILEGGRVRWGLATGERNEHVDEARVWKRPRQSPTSLFWLLSARSSEEKRPLCGWKEEDLLLFSQVATGHRAREDKRYKPKNAPGLHVEFHFRNVIDCVVLSFLGGRGVRNPIVKYFRFFL